MFKVKCRREAGRVEAEGKKRVGENEEERGR